MVLSFQMADDMLDRPRNLNPGDIVYWKGQITQLDEVCLVLSLNSKTWYGDPGVRVLKRGEVRKFPRDLNDWGGGTLL